MVWGQLLGASGVLVGASLYDVEFVEGTCVELFGGCNENSDFTFNSREDAETASRALDQQVFLGIHDNDPSLTFGINSIVTSQIWTPYSAFESLDGPAVSLYVLFDASPDRGGDGPGGDVDGSNAATSFSCNGFDEYSFARWRPAVTAAPLPAGGWFLITAISGLAGLGRLRGRCQSKFA